MNALPNFQQQGNNAHTIEVEQILTIEMPDGVVHHHSHIHTRGSIPLLWKQPPDVFPSPRVSIVEDRGEQEAAFVKFADSMLKRHKVGDKANEKLNKQGRTI